jgi:hypothetical protein
MHWCLFIDFYLIDSKNRTFYYKQKHCMISKTDNGICKQDSWVIMTYSGCCVTCWVVDFCIISMLVLTRKIQCSSVFCRLVSILIIIILSDFSSFSILLVMLEKSYCHTSLSNCYHTYHS